MLMFAQFDLVLLLLGHARFHLGTLPVLPPPVERRAGAIWGMAKTRLPLGLV